MAAFSLQVRLGHLFELRPAEDRGMVLAEDTVQNFSNWKGNWVEDGHQKCDKAR